MNDQGSQVDHDESTFHVEILYINNPYGEIEKIGRGMSYRMAEKTERGININLNHSAYYTMIVADDS